MISAVDAALRELIEGMPGDDDVNVAFDAPTRDWASRQSSASTVNCFLYEVREDPSRTWLDDRSVRRTDDEAVIARRPRVRHFRLAYLVTVWAKEPRDEHNVLDQLLRLFLDTPGLSSEARDTSLEDYPASLYPVQVELAKPRPNDQNGLTVSDLWSAIGGELRPSLELVIRAPIVPSAIDVPDAHLVREELTLDVGLEDDDPERANMLLEDRRGRIIRRRRERIGGHDAVRDETGAVVVNPPGFGPRAATGVSSGGTDGCGNLDSPSLWGMR